MAATSAPPLLPDLARWKASAGIVWRGLGHRAQLAALEAEEARIAAARTAAWLSASIVVLLLAGVAFNGLIAAAFWDTPHRVTALAILAGVESIAGSIFAWRARRHWRRGKPFAALRQQLDHDRSLLEKMLEQSDR